MAQPAYQELVISATLWPLDFSGADDYGGRTRKGHTSATAGLFLVLESLFICYLGAATSACR